MLLPLMLLLACSQETVSAPAAAATAVATWRTSSPVPTRHRPSIELTGSLEPVASVQLGFDVPGRIVALEVERGDRVSRGSPIARLDTDLAAAQVAQAEAAVAGAEAQLAAGESAYTRAVKMKEAGGLSEQQFADAEAGIKAARAGAGQARAALQMARSQLSRHTLRAPIAGIVTNGPDNVGTLVGAGTPLFVIEDLSALQMKATVPESASWLAPGQTVTLLGGTPGTTTPTTATVVRIIPSLDPATRRVPVEVRIDHPDASLRAHAFTRARVEATTEVDAWTIPRDAIVARPDFSVFLATPDGAPPRRVPVTILEDDGQNAIVTGALAPTDAVIQAPPSTLGVE